MLGLNNLTILIAAVSIGALVSLFGQNAIGWFGQSLFNGLIAGSATWFALQWIKNKSGR